MKYLNICIDGRSPIKAYENSQKKSEKHPDFKGDGVAVWVNEGRQKLDGEKEGG